MSADDKARRAVRAWHADPTPAHAQTAMTALARAGLLPDSGEGLEPETRPKPGIRVLGPNQTVIVDERHSLFYSYETLSAALLLAHDDEPMRAIFVRPFPSRTTAKHVRAWLARVAPAPMRPRGMSRDAFNLALGLRGDS